MTKKAKKKRFKHLIRKYPHHYLIDKEKIESQLIRAKEGGHKIYYSLLIEKQQIYMFGSDLGFTIKEINTKWRDASIERLKESYKYNKMPEQVHRDNKTTHNYGSRNHHGNVARYPRKNRSVKVWTNFYKLFPYLAKYDGWDGKTSKKMK